MAGNDFDGIKYRDEKGAPLIFKLLFGCLATWAICFMGYYLFSGWSSQQEFAEKKKLADAKMAEAEKSENAPAPGGGVVHKETNPAASLALGKKLYSERCVACHGPEAKGGIGPDLTKADFKYGKSEAAIMESVTNGRPGGMPGFGKELSHLQLEGAVTYILSLK